MKIIVTGSLGHISKPLSIELLKNGHDVTIVSSDTKKRSDIEDMGAKAAIGSVQDEEFLLTTFAGADAVYTMVPPASYMQADLDPVAILAILDASMPQLS
jgi:uncharacterized protein YbjT (DUF2867 family)